ncbi:MAG: hypothetical protein OEY94_05360 [Alphaproteobacteria bacterium]|nr:hypothetical protein [Alphaproteobacteria bacterium]
MLDKRPIIGVMGSHQEEWEEYADPVGDLLARRGFNLLTGAGGGIMTVVARSFTQVDNRKGMAIGILPAVDYKGQNLDKEEYPNPYIEIPMVTPLSAKAQSDAMPFSRNLTNVMTAHALIILPGSHGTKNEVSLGLIYNKPLILFGPEDAFAHFPEEPARANDISQIDEFLTNLFGQ